jgi:hypothetical protein
LFVEYASQPVVDEHGNVHWHGRMKDVTFERPAWLWEPLYCRHRGPGRLTWTALLVHAERVDGQPRQKLLLRFPAIRSCCVKEPFTLAAWWHAVTGAIRSREEWADSGPFTRFLARDRKAILAALREVAPRPGRAGVRAFNAYRLQKEAEKQRVWQERQEEQRRQEQARQREQARRQQQRWRRASAGAFGGHGGPAGPPWWRVLGVPAGAGLEEVKRAYRELAMQHHPDRGGDAVRFMEVQQAFEAARAELEDV